MTNTAADQPISALRTGHDHLVALVHSLSADALNGPSGASKWTIAQVLSHLGSGAEIALAALRSSIDGAEKAADDFNQSVWDRWNAKTSREQAHGFMIANEKLVRRYENLDGQTRTTAEIDLGFLPAPVPVGTAASFRLNEFALHAWDVEVAGNPAAVVAADAVEPLLEVLPFLLGWVGKPADVLGGRSVTVGVHTTSPDRVFGLAITDDVALTDVPPDPDASLLLPAESWLRLAYGRLAPQSTPPEVSVAGALTLDELRRVFPGF
jgi:uncharacterized protein (TIGR03083 family)